MGGFFFFCGWKIALYHCVLWLLVSPTFPIRGRPGQSEISPEPGQGTVHTPHEWSCGAFSPSVKMLGSLRGI